MSYTVILSLLLFACGTVIGVRLSYRFLVIALIAFTASSLVFELALPAPYGIADLVPGLIALQFGYLAGVFGATWFRERGSGRK